MQSKKLKTKQKYSWQFDAIGTWWTIESTTEISREIKKSITEFIDVFDKVYSRFRNDSLVSLMAHKQGVFEFPASSEKLWELYEKLHEATSGAMSPLVGNSLEALGYDKNYTFKAGRPLVSPKWSDVINRRGAVVATQNKVLLDFGAAGKGLLVDELRSVLENNGIEAVVIDASGDVAVKGLDQQIGLESPFDSAMVIGVVTIKNESICASAINRRRWGKKNHHIIDARTGRPVNDIVATWVIADSTMVADGLASALFFVPAEKLTAIARFDYVRMLSNGTIEYSKRFVGQLFI